MRLDFILTGCPELRCAGHETGRVCGMMWALWGTTARAPDGVLLAHPFFIVLLQVVMHQCGITKIS